MEEKDTTENGSSQAENKPEANEQKNIETSEVEESSKSDQTEEKIKIFDEETPIKNENQQEVKQKPERKKDNIVLYSIIIIIVALVLVFYLPRFIGPSGPMTLDKLHERNLVGKLNEDQGYLYNGIHSFVNFDNLWYVRIFNPIGNKMFNVPFHYGPRDVDDIEIIGVRNDSIFNEYDGVYMTFDPLDENLQYIAVATGEIDAVLLNLFGKGVEAACTRNETTACINRPIINCNSTQAPVIYLASEEETAVLYLNNCLIITGSGEDLLRATDRFLFDLINIIE